MRKMQWLSVVAVASLMVLVQAPAVAQDISMLPEGQTLITLSVTQRVEVEQDLLIATLNVEGEHQNAATLQNEINERMSSAMEKVKAHSQIEVSTGHYSVYQINRPEQGARTNATWRGSQSLTLESKDSETLLALVGELQELKLVMNQLSYTLSTAKADEARDSLMESALVKAKQNAERAAAALGKFDVDIASVNIDESFAYQGPKMERAMAMDAVSARVAPVAEPSETEVTLTVRVQAIAK